MVLITQQNIKAAIAGYYRNGADIETISIITGISTFEVEKIIENYLADYKIKNSRYNGCYTKTNIN